MEEWRAREREEERRRMLLDGMLTDGYKNPKEEAYRREEWFHLDVWNSPRVENSEKKRSCLPLRGLGAILKHCWSQTMLDIF